MNSPVTLPVQRRINVLTLDGGGVRGLSSLLILDELMRQINDSIRALSGLHSNLLPHQIFHLVAGTSTGGLISLMLGKLGMNIKDCIEEYRNFSEAIFKRKQLLAIRGFFRSKYSGSTLEGCVRDLVRRRCSKENLDMPFNKNDKIACAVVCREYKNESLTREAVCICSLPCSGTNGLVCLVSQAARATSAAPTYFPVQKIADRSFVDGGLQFNNPSYVIFQHYSRPILVKESQTESATKSVPHTLSHDKLDFTKVRIINLGTGTKADASSSRRSFITKIMPGARYAIFLANIFREIVGDSEGVVDFMTSIDSINGGYPDVEYKRFSANNGVGDIKMDGYKDLAKIEKLTRDYLDIPQVKAELKRVGEGIASEYLYARATESRPANLAGPEQELSRPQASAVQPSELPPPEVPPSVGPLPEGPHTPPRPPNNSLSLHTKSSGGTCGSPSERSKSVTLNGSPARTLVGSSPVRSGSPSDSSLEDPSGAKSSRNGVEEIRSDSNFVE